MSAKDILNGGLNGALARAAAGELAVGDAAKIAASAMTRFKLSGDKLPHAAATAMADLGISAYDSQRKLCGPVKVRGATQDFPFRVDG